MKNEKREVYYDADLDIELYHFEGMKRKFPTHFHDYYVIGLIRSGQRTMRCGGKDYVITPNDIVLFNPGEPHACEQIENYALDYYGINLTKAMMLRSVQHFSKANEWLPVFQHNVVHDVALAKLIRECYATIIHETDVLVKEEKLFSLLAQLVPQPLFVDPKIVVPQENLLYSKEFIRANYQDKISLDDLASYSSFSKYYFIREFTKAFGVTPYNYLQTIRIENAKKFLKAEIPAIDVAGMVGFSDQSHLTDFFKRFIGVTPVKYQMMFKEKE